MRHRPVAGIAGCHRGTARRPARPAARGRHGASGETAGGRRWRSSRRRRRVERERRLAWSGHDARPLLFHPVLDRWGSPSGLYQRIAPCHTMTCGLRKRAAAAKPPRKLAEISGEYMKKCRRSLRRGRPADAQVDRQGRRREVHRRDLDDAGSDVHDNIPSCVGSRRHNGAPVRGNYTL